MSAKRLRLTRKAPTQIELERENAELKRRNQQLEKRLKQAVRQLRRYEDVQSDIQAQLEAEIADIDRPEEKKEDSDHLVFILPDGTIKKIAKRSVVNE